MNKSPAKTIPDSVGLKPGATGYLAFSAAAPAVFIFILSLFAPKVVERLVVAYTAIHPDSDRGIYLPHIVVEIICRIYNTPAAALLFAAAAAGACWLLWSLRGRLSRGGAFDAFVEALSAVFLFLCLAVFLRAPRPLLLTACLTAAYLTSFMFAGSLTTALGQGGRPFLLLPFSLAALPHLLLPAPFFESVLSRFSRNAFRRALLCGRVWVCLVTIPLFSFSAYSLRKPYVSPRVRPLLAQPNLYDIVVDKPAKRLLVTLKESGNVWVLDLDTLRPVKMMEIPTEELESLVLDPQRREIYHVNRADMEILALNADNFKVLRRGHTPVLSSGSTKIALERTSGKLLISWENDNLFMADRDSMKCEFLGRPGNVNPIADEDHGMVYFNSEKGRFVQALDLGRRLRGTRAAAPYRGERMALSRARNELFIPDPISGRIWVYSTPWLGLLRKIPSQFGVRALAVDDEHGLLISASVATGYLEVQDLADGRRVERYYIGRYPRIIRLDTARRLAFVTLMREGLFVVHY